MHSVESTHATHTFVNPAQLYDPRPNAYTHVVTANTPARIIHVAGQGGEDDTGRLAADFEMQVKQAMTNLGAALAAADSTFSEVVKITVLIVDHDADRLAIFGRALGAAWGSHPPPACTLIPVARLALDGMLFEIDAMAVSTLPASLT